MSNDGWEKFDHCMVVVLIIFGVVLIIVQLGKYYGY